MKNKWSVYKSPLAQWNADLTANLNDPDKLLNWLQFTIECGEKFKIFNVLKAPLLDYEYQKDGSFSEYITKHYREKKILDMFNFTRSGMRLLNGEALRCTTNMCYFKSNGEIVNEPVENAGLLRKLLDTLEFKESIHRPKVPCISITGPSLNFKDLDQSLWNGKKNTLKISFELYCDNWYPYVPSIYEENYEPNKMYENTELSSIHTPLLNEFIQNMTEITNEISGNWELNKDWCHPMFLKYTSKTGISIIT